MKRFSCVNIKLLFIILNAMIFAIPSSIVKAEPALSWSDGAKIVSKFEVGDIITDKCPYTHQVIQLPNSSVRRIACVYTSNKIQIAQYFGVNSFEISIKSIFDDKFHKINYSCASSSPCIYIESSDTLISQEHHGSSSRTLVFYDNFTKRLSHNLSDFSTFDFNTNNPSFVINRDSSYIGDVGAFGVSENGKYAAFEMTSRGYAFIDITSKSIKRMSRTSPQYNNGSNPSMEFSVSNDGQFIAIAGTNADFSIINNANNCGDWPSFNDIIAGLVLENQCSTLPVTANDYVERSRFIHNPKFNKTSNQLSIDIYTYTNKYYKLTISTLDYTQKQIDYIAMGDSFSSGEGDLSDYFYRENTNAGVDKCHTSLNAYSYKLLNPSILDRTRIVNIACSGAVTGDIIGNDNYLGQNNRLSSFINQDIEILKTNAIDNFTPGRIPQKEFIKKYQPSIATIGIGGNDVDLVGKLIACLSTQYCAQANTADGKAKTAKEIQNLFYSLTNTYSSIINESPNTKLYAVGYPKIIKTGTCNFTFNSFLDSYEREYADESIEYINQVIEAAAKYVGIKYIDISESLNGYRLCDEDPLAVNALRSGEEAVSVPTILGYVNIIGSESFHPTPYGHQLIADTINSEIGDLATYQYCANGEITCPDRTVIAPNPSGYWGVADMNSITNVRSIGYVLFDGKTFTINTPEGLLLPSTKINIKIHSDPINVGEFMTNDTGSLNISFQKPENLEYGVHTIILSGKTFTGENIELQQIFQYIKPKPQTIPTAVSQTLENTTTPTNTISSTELKLNSSINRVATPVVESEPAVLSETSTIPEATSTNVDNTIESVEQADKFNDISIVAIVIAVFSLFIFIRYVFFDSKLSNKK